MTAEIKVVEKVNIVKHLMCNVLLAPYRNKKNITSDVAPRGSQQPLVPPTSDSDRVSLRRCAF